MAMNRVNKIVSHLQPSSSSSLDLKSSNTVEKAAGHDKQTSIKLITRYGQNKENINISFMPQVGLGTWRSEKNKVLNAVEYALKCGYKHIDCAYGYRNEDEVGKALTSAISNGYISREKLFITSKLWNTKHHYDDVIPSLKETLNDLNLDYLDLYLIHWPINFKRGKNVFPKNEDGTMQYGDVIPLLDTWRAMEKAVEMGLVKHIGLSNFNSKQIKYIINNAKILPAVLQCESHPYFCQSKLVNFCKENNIVFTAYSPLGSPSRPSDWDYTLPAVMENKYINQLAKKYNVTPANICIRFQVDRGCIVIPKSVTNSRILSNLQVWNFKLTNDEMKKLYVLNKEIRYCSPKVTKTDGSRVWRDASHPHFPFNAEF